MTKRIEKLYIFNLATDLDNTLLAFTHDWIRACLSEANSVEVVSTHIGRIDLPSNVRVREIGGGNFPKRVVGILRLLRITVEIGLNRKQAVVFFHMTNRVAALIGLPLRIIGVRQGLWYSHSSIPISLKFAAKFSNILFSSSPHALPISNEKCKYVNHGIDFSRFPAVANLEIDPQNTFISLGRVSPIKNLELFIDAVSKSKSASKIINLAGPSCAESEYQKSLVKFAETVGITLRFLGEVPYPQVPTLLSQFSICYTGNPRTTDKAAIEAAAVGCFVISNEPDTRKLTGMTEYWQINGIDPSDLVSQINFLLDVQMEPKLRLEISIRARERNNVTNTIEKIMTGLRDA
jgi:glycosyltransferase involved in cell wall biosynthesis